MEENNNYPMNNEGSDGVGAPQGEPIQQNIPPQGEPIQQNIPPQGEPVQQNVPPQGEPVQQNVPPQGEPVQQNYTYRQAPPQSNVYRFQDTPPNPAPKKKKERTTGKMILFGAAFGIVAAVCFSLVTFFAGGIFKNGENRVASNNSSDGSIKSVEVSPASGAAVGAVDLSGVVESVMPSIVAITEQSTQHSIFGQSYSSEGAGSGFIVKQDNDQLLVVTNNHVVEGADKISVQFNDGESVDATVKGTSEINDLAVLTVPLKSIKDSTKKSIKVANLGSSDDVKVGQMVIAIGNALGFGQSVTVGYVSAKECEVSTRMSSGKVSTQILMRTDAAINPGNSGGALIDINGNVIGINSRKEMTYGGANVEGMGYAIPMSKATTVINDLMDRQVLKDEEKGYLGITGKNISEDMSKSYGIPIGVYVSSISDTGAAYKAGIKEGDVITKIDSTKVTQIEEVQNIVNNTKVGTTITVTIMRLDDGKYKEKEVKVTLKNKDTLNGLPSSSDSQDNDSGDYYQEIPWSGGLY